MEFDRVLYINKKVYVYKIPPPTTAKGYKAEEWDVNNYIWSGRLRILANDSKVTIVLEDDQGSLFASSPYDQALNTLEQVTDSSRYFVLKVVDSTTGNHAFLGLGFQERSEAFDFQIALQDFGKSISNAKPDKKEREKIDFSLKEGQTISLKIGQKSKHMEKKSDTNLENCTFTLLKIVTIAPPPTANKDWVKFQ